METVAHTPLQRHPKCSALYASQLRRDSETLKSVDPLALSVASLANLTVDVTTKALTRDASTFALTVHDHKTSSRWRHLRSYAECRAFQSRVLTVLSRGHLCFAECPWLFAYVQRALPAEGKGHRLFRLASHCPKPRVVEIQRQALARLFATLQRVLLNPLNHKCPVLMQQVAPEVVTFITNRCEAKGQEPLNSPTSDRPLAKTFSESFMFELEAGRASSTTTDDFGQSSTSTTGSIEDLAQDVPENESEPLASLEKVVEGQRVCCAMCALHKKRSDEQVFACWRAESMTSRLMRLRAGAGAERTSITAKRQLPTQSEAEVKGVWEPPTLSQRATSPLEPLGGRESEAIGMVVPEHEGTPTEPFPGSPGTPGTARDSVASSSRASSVCQIDLEELDTWRLSSAVPSPPRIRHTAPQVKAPDCSGLGNVRRMPRRSLLVFSSIRSKFAPSKNRAGGIII